MTRHWHPTLDRIVRWLRQSAQSFAAAAAVYGPDLMLQLHATTGAVRVPPSPERDGRSWRSGRAAAARFRPLRPVTRRTLATGRPLSVDVGPPRVIEWDGKPVRTAIWKEPVDGPRMVRRINIDGDDQADRFAHSGEHRAVFVEPIEAYRSCVAR